ncbi:MerR family transcriptional regulator [Umezawaea tangerina]|uniref:DNA-binding transcriptional MerR regulator n=1 Tax=Umezawaea tangerina TaxID=84725 RepID=A0A2T0SZP0_9PSEU|nr:MerR family transcriptional regulator [Umezawaea tangerina]PRY38885.1 DNA-binding transcriptional MerR regulator [Umezawaea tangerina]
MPWSTRELADLARTSLRTVRHYQELGLLCAPPRDAKGYKQYGTEHLVQLLRIKRLTNLGFSLSQVATALDEPDNTQTALLHRLDDELTLAIAQLERTRDDVRDVLRLGIAPDVPPELAHALNPRDRTAFGTSLGIVVSHLLGPVTAEVLSALDQEHREKVISFDREFVQLAADAGPDARERLARAAIDLLAVLLEHPGDRVEARPVHPDAYRNLDAVLPDLLNPAQADVVRRIQEGFGHQDPDDSRGH